MLRIHHAVSIQNAHESEHQRWIDARCQNARGVQYRPRASHGTPPAGCKRGKLFNAQACLCQKAHESDDASAKRHCQNFHQIQCTSPGSTHGARTHEGSLSSSTEPCSVRQQRTNARTALMYIYIYFFFQFPTSNIHYSKRCAQRNGCRNKKVTLDGSSPRTGDNSSTSGHR